MRIIGHSKNKLGLKRRKDRMELFEEHNMIQQIWNNNLASHLRRGSINISSKLNSKFLLSSLWTDFFHCHLPTSSSITIPHLQPPLISHHNRIFTSKKLTSIQSTSTFSNLYLFPHLDLSVSQSINHKSLPYFRQKQSLRRCVVPRPLHA